MNNLEAYRDKINDIDKKIVELLEKRFEISTSIGNYKRENNMPVQDIKREESIMNNINSSLKDNNYGEAIRKVYSVIINVSKMFQY